MANTVPPELDEPGPHPDPPAGITGWDLPIIEVGHPWFRVHTLGQDPLFFGRLKTYRFDAPAGQFGVLYAGKDEHGAFIETFGQARRSTTGKGLVTTAQLGTKGLARIEVAEPLRLVDLTGAGLAKIGADGRLHTGSRAIAQRWSLALHDHRAAPDGILYRARHDPSRQAAALFDRAKRTLKAIRLGSLANPSHVGLLSALLDDYHFDLIVLS